MGNKRDGNVRIISHSNEVFRNRSHAGQLLAEQLTDLRGARPVALGIPRGGIVIARELAHALDGDLDVVLSRKLGTPGQPELAMGSLAEHGTVFLNEDIVRTLGVSRQDIEQERRRQMVEIQRRTTLIRSTHPRIPLRDRIVIISDDGVATGATIQAALWVVRQESPWRLIAAIPVASEEALKKVALDADEVVCLRQPSFFHAVGQWYREFPQLDDAHVLRILEAESAGRTMAQEQKGIRV